MNPRQVHERQLRGGRRAPPPVKKKMIKTKTVAVAVMAVAIISAPALYAQQAHKNVIIDLWRQGKPAFGIYAPNENPGPRGEAPRPALYTRDGGEKLAMNPLYDFVFLNLEGSYDANAAKAIADGCAVQGYRPQDPHRQDSSGRQRRCGYGQGAHQGSPGCGRGAIRN